MKRFTIGSSLVLALLVFGFMGQGGKTAAIANGAVLLSLTLFVMGSLVLAFGVVRPMQMVADAFRSPGEGIEGRLLSHVLVCECASRASLFGACITGLMGTLVAVDSMGGDVFVVGYRLAVAMLGPVYGAILSAWFFTPLKHRFLLMDNAPIAHLPPRAARSLGKDFFVVMTGIIVTVYLIVAYLIKFIPFLMETLRE